MEASLQKEAERRSPGERVVAALPGGFKSASREISDLGTFFCARPACPDKRPGTVNAKSD
jgi:hypothetical protein